MKRLVIKVVSVGAGLAVAEVVRPGSVTSLLAGAVEGLGVAAGAF